VTPQEWIGPSARTAGLSCLSSRSRMTSSGRHRTHRPPTCALRMPALQAPEGCEFPRSLRQRRRPDEVPVWRSKRASDVRNRPARCCQATVIVRRPPLSRQSRWPPNSSAVFWAKDSAHVWFTSCQLDRHGLVRRRRGRRPGTELSPPPTRTRSAAPTTTASLI
jgi:hypothetical protein